MPEYLAPGVFVEETSFRSKSIEGVGTSVAGIVGPTRTGPLRGVPTLVTSYREYTRAFGDDDDLVFGTGDAATHVANQTALAARAFFDNGGKQLFVTRVIKGGNDTDASGFGGSAAIASRRDANSVLTFTSRFAGAAGNVALELRWRDSANLLRTAPTTDVQVGDIVYVQVTNELDISAFDDGPADSFVGRFPLKSFRSAGVVKSKAIDGDDVQFLEFAWADATMVGSDGQDFSHAVDGLRFDKFPAGTVVTRASLAPPIGEPLADGATVQLSLNGRVTMGDVDFGTERTVLGTMKDNATAIAFTQARNPGLVTEGDVAVQHLAAYSDVVKALVTHRTFDIDVLPLSRDGKTLGAEPIFTFGNVATSTDDASSLTKRMEPSTSDERTTMPVKCSIAAGASSNGVLDALYDLFDQDLLEPAASSPDDARYVVKLGHGANAVLGTDGDVPLSLDYAGEEDEVGGSTGFKALELVEDVAIVMTPSAATHESLAEHQAVVLEMQKHCRRMKYRVGLVDSRQGMGVTDVRDWRSLFTDSRLALYHPWVRIPSGRPEGGERLVPPAGSIAGVYARTDVTRGVHKAPANEVVLGALGFEQEINTFQQELLNPNGVNCLRSFPNHGHRVWGGRTLTDDPEWKYVNVRRYFLYLERSIDRATQWVVFEPNGEQLWENIRATVDGFLFNEWRNGRLLGPAPKDAYFVRCDRSTMTQNDLDNGRLVCLVGVAPLRPAEFVIFRIGQKTADA